MNNSNESTVTEDIIPNIWNDHFLFTLLFVKVSLAFTTVALNICVIVIVLFMIAKKSYSNYLFLSKSVSDLIVGGSSMVFMTIYTSYGYWPLGYSLCVFWVIFDFSSCAISIFNLLLITLHRYRQLTTPFKVTEDLSKLKYLQIILVWVVSFTFWASSVLPITSKDFVAEDCYYMYTFTYVFLSDMSAYGIPIIVLIILNFLTIHALNKKVKRVAHGFVKADTNQTMTQVDTGGEQSILTTTNKQPMANENQNKHKTKEKVSGKDRKAIITIVAVSVTLILCWIIFIVTWPIKAECDECVSNLLYEIGYWLAYANSTINPIILFIFHTNFSREFRRLISAPFKFCKKFKH